MFKVLKTDGVARRGEFHTPHGVIQSPFFMNVGTSAAIKGGISSLDLKDLKCQVELCNTYHLHVRPGDDIIYKMGGLHKFMNWDRPILTDSGGFQVFSLAKLRKIKEEGVYFNSHVDGRRIFMGPEESMRIQSHLASTIAMAFDECIENPSPYDYVKKSVDRTTRWLQRCIDEMARLNSLPETINRQQMLFAINQGGTYDDIRAEHMKTIANMNVDGVAIGGLISGVAFTMKSLKPDIKVYGVQAAGAPSMQTSVKDGKIECLDHVSTIADGIAVKEPGSNTFELCRKYVDDIVTVTDDEISTAILTLIEKHKLIAEGAGAVPVAAVMFNKVPVKGKKVVCLVSGGNIDVTILSRVIKRGLIKSGRTCQLNIALIDKPGQLKGVSQIIADLGGNVISVHHERANEGEDVNGCYLRVELETRNYEHIAQIRKALTDAGYSIE